MKVAVIGIGTAGITSLCHMLRWLDSNSTVTSIYDPNIKMFGIGETMEPDFVTTLYEGTDFVFHRDAQELDSTLKLGISFKNWRENNFTAYIPPPTYSIHFNNFKLKDFAFKRFKELWNNKFQVIEGTVSSLENNNSSACITINNKDYEFDFVIDCRGTPKNFKDYTIATETVNSVLVKLINSPSNRNTTLQQAHENGWTFNIPLSTRQGQGYLYNNNITSKNEAIKDFKKILKTEDEDFREISFKSYYANKFFDGRILKNGNSALFLEPIEATSGFFYSTALRYLIDYIYNGISIDTVNIELSNAAKDLEIFINFIYHGGSKYNTPFWNKTKEKTQDFLSKNQRWKNIIKDIKMLDDNSIVARWTVGHWKMWDEKLNYGYFKEI